MIVMIMAITPSLKASNLPFLMPRGYAFGTAQNSKTKQPTSKACAFLPP
jgi:hypothetical protein